MNGNDLVKLILFYLMIFSVYRKQRQPPEVFCRKGALRNFAKIDRKTPVPESFLIKLQAGLQLIKKETLAQVFSREFCEITKSIFFYRIPPAAASVKM